jgi:antirestriction protein ArdC
MQTKQLQESIANNVIKLMSEHGTNWTMPWLVDNGMPTNAANGNEYHGINIMLLAMQNMATSEWATYKQWHLKDAQVKKGEHGTHIIFYKPLSIKDKDTGKDKTIPLMRNYTVFNADQVDGYESQTTIEKPCLVEKIKTVETFIKNTNATIVHSGKAFYRPGDDTVNIPDPDLFKDTESSTAQENYYSTLLHELVHWTGNKDRLNRKILNQFSSKDYAKEELVAELGATFLCISLGITKQPRVDHAQYLNSWLSVLKNDTNAIFRASAMAGRASDYLHGLQEPQPQS